MGVVEIIYGGESYRIPDRSIEDVQQQIDQILATGSTGWIDAVDGNGGKSLHRLLITAGAAVALTDIPLEYS